MPTYQNHCDNCSFEWEQIQSYQEEAIKDCPDCKGADCVRRVFSLMYIGGCGQMTLGGLADRNRKTLGNTASTEILQKMANERRGQVSSFKGHVPEGASQLDSSKNIKPDLSLNNLTNEQKIRYIQTGKRPPKDDSALRS